MIGILRRDVFEEVRIATVLLIRMTEIFGFFWVKRGKSHLTHQALNVFPTDAHAIPLPELIFHAPGTVERVSGVDFIQSVHGRDISGIHERLIL